MASTDGTREIADLAADNARLRARVAELEAAMDRLAEAAYPFADGTIVDETAVNVPLMDELANALGAADDLLPDPDEPDPATLARAAGLEGGFDETAVEPAGLTWEAYNR